MTWLATPSGRFDLEHPERYTFRIEEIAHALSNLCRFSGHGFFYSVAEHSVNVSRLLEGDARLFGLLHDAHEPYTGGDIASPIKKISPNILDLEQDVQIELDLQLCPNKWNAYDLIESEVKQADSLMLAVEARRVLGVDPREWGLDVDWNRVDELTETIRGMGRTPLDARRMFLERWEELTKSRDLTESVKRQEVDK